MKTTSTEIASELSNKLVSGDKSKLKKLSIDSWESLASWLNTQIELWQRFPENRYQGIAVSTLIKNIETLQYPIMSDKSFDSVFAARTVSSVVDGLHGIVESSSKARLLLLVLKKDASLVIATIEAIIDDSGALWKDLARKLSELIESNPAIEDMMRVIELESEFETDEIVGSSFFMSATRPITLRSLDMAVKELHEKVTSGMSFVDEFEISSRLLIAEMESARDASDATTRTLREEMSLLPTVDYWSKRVTAHEKKSDSILTYLLSFVLITIAFLALVFSLAWKNTNYLSNLADFEAVLIGGLALFLSTVILWAARIITRLYLGNIHLANDARERATLIETYLALNLENAATEADRAQIIAAIFRRSTDGVVRDDGAPLTPATILGAFGVGSSSR